ncbi:MAG: N-acyl-D-amino-acid deacylase family protein [Planctomycetota bacterium]|jgi:N-acyl-D-aspartate/D-glutamate deacylase
MSNNIGPYDIIVKNARVFDGSLKPAFPAEVAIRDGTIVKVETSIDSGAVRVIDGRGFYICPGFIDLHSHADWWMYLPENRACLNFLKQGVTSVVVGQCGYSAWPIFEKAEDQMARWTQEGIGPNVALLVGHRSVREIVMGQQTRDPTPEELARMKSLVVEAMEQGACGLSTGLSYTPYVKTKEVIELVRAIVPYGGIYHTHIRNLGDGFLEAIGEAIQIAEQTRAATHISHLMVIERKNWGLVKQACGLIEQAQTNGLKITADQYPYCFSVISPYVPLIPRSAWRGKEGSQRVNKLDSDIERMLGSLEDQELIELYKETTSLVPITKRHEHFLDELPRSELVRRVSRNLIDRSHLYGKDNARERMSFLRRMEDPDEAQEIRKAITDHIDRLCGAENFIIGICVERNLEGKSLKEAAAIKSKSIPDTAVELDLMGAKCVPMKIHEADVEYVMKRDYVGTGSDGTAITYGVGLPHIRCYSTFLRKIKKYALEKNTVSVPHVIRSQTSLPAQIMNWHDRGWIKEGYKADVVILDLDNIVTGASISQPHQYCEGVEYLIINGQVVIDQGKWNSKLPGKVLKLKGL